jgi:hypothetical protein
MSDQRSPLVSDPGPTSGTPQGEEEDGYITDDGDGLRIWIGDAAFELEPADPEAGR